MNQDQKERKKHRSLMRKQIQDKIDRELKELEENRIKEKEKRDNRTKEEHDKFLERLERHKNERSQRKKDWTEKDKETNKKSYLYKQLEDRYEKEVKLPELEKKKQELDNLRNFYKPIKKEELDEH